MALKQAYGAIASVFVEAARIDADVSTLGCVGAARPKARLTLGRCWMTVDCRGLAPSPS